MVLGQTTHYAVNDDGEHLLAYQISDLACNFRVFPTGGSPNASVGDDSSLTPKSDYTVLSFDTIAWELNDTYQLFVAEAARFGQPFQKLGKMMVEGATTAEPFPETNPAVSHDVMALVGTFTAEEIFAEAGIDIGEFVNNLLSSAHERYLYLRFRFEVCTDADADPDLVKLHRGGDSNPDSVHILQGGTVVELPNKLFFAQFADGEGVLSSTIVLVNPSDILAAEVRIILNLGSGAPMEIDLNGEVVEGVLELMIAPGAVVSLETDGLGDIQQGSVTVCSDVKLVGVVLFSGILGFAGVGSGEPLQKAVAPIGVELATGINSGVAVMALGQAVTIQVSLLDVAGILIASAVVELSALGQDARNINDYEWDVKGIDFSNIQGSVVLSGTEEFAAIVILVRPDQFATLPVGKQLAAMPDLNQVQ